MCTVYSGSAGLVDTAVSVVAEVWLIDCSLHHVIQVGMRASLCLWLADIVRKDSSKKNTYQHV